MKRVVFCFLIVFNAMIFSDSCYATTAETVLQERIEHTDSLLMKLLITPEMYRKDNAPVDDIFRRLLEQHPEFLALIRTNAKGEAVNAVYRDDSAAILPGSNVTKSLWFNTPRKNFKPYYSSLIHDDQHYSIQWSKPLIIKGTLGLDKFGGAIMAQINIAAFFKQFAVTFREPFKILLDGKEFFYIAWYDNIPFEDKPITIPGVSGFTIRYIQNSETAKSLMNNPDTTQPQAAGSSAAVTQTKGTGVSAVELPGTPASPAPISAFDYFMTNRTLQLYSIAVLVLLLLLTIIYSNVKKKHPAKGSRGEPDQIHNNEPVASSSNTMDNQPDEIIRSTAPSVEQLRQRIRQHNEHSNSTVHTSALFSEKKVPVFPQSSDSTTVGDEAATADVSFTKPFVPHAERVLEEPAEELISGADASGEETFINGHTGEIEPVIDSNVAKTMYQEELQKLRRSISDKLIEKELPILLKTQKMELAKDIQKKVEGLYAAEMEQQEREAMRLAIVERLRRDEYPLMLKKEQERLSGTSDIPIAESGSSDGVHEVAQSLRHQLRSEIKAEVSEEYHSIISDIKQLSLSMGDVEALRSLSETVRLLLEQKNNQTDFKLDATETDSLLNYLKRVQGRLQAELDSFHAVIQELVPRIDNILADLNEEQRTSHD
jgi:hypothetical protein